MSSEGGRIQSSSRWRCVNLVPIYTYLNDRAVHAGISNGLQLPQNSELSSFTCSFSGISLFNSFKSVRVGIFKCFWEKRIVLWRLEWRTRISWSVASAANRQNASNLTDSKNCITVLAYFTGLTVLIFWLFYLTLTISPKETYFSDIIFAKAPEAAELRC